MLDKQVCKRCLRETFVLLQETHPPREWVCGVCFRKALSLISGADYKRATTEDTYTALDIEEHVVDINGTLGWGGVETSR